jgi:hypothetical protein
MPRDLLERAHDAVETARDATASSDRQDRLGQLATHLRSQIHREATPALGTLDRVQTKLREIKDDTDEESVVDAVADAREHILSFLGTLDDRGMKQHRGKATASDTDQ